MASASTPEGGEHVPLPLPNSVTKFLQQPTFELSQVIRNKQRDHSNRRGEVLSTGKTFAHLLMEYGRDDLVKLLDKHGFGIEPFKTKLPPEDQKPVKEAYSALLFGVTYLALADFLETPPIRGENGYDYLFDHGFLLSMYNESLHATGMDTLPSIPIPKEAKMTGDNKFEIVDEATREKLAAAMQNKFDANLFNDPVWMQAPKMLKEFLSQLSASAPRIIEETTVPYFKKHMKQLAADGQITPLDLWKGVQYFNTRFAGRRDKPAQATQIPSDYYEAFGDKPPGYKPPELTEEDNKTARRLLNF